MKTEFLSNDLEYRLKYFPNEILIVIEEKLRKRFNLQAPWQSRVSMNNEEPRLGFIEIASAPYSSKQKVLEECVEVYRTAGFEVEIEQNALHVRKDGKEVYNVLVMQTESSYTLQVR